MTEEVWDLDADEESADCIKHISPPCPHYGQRNEADVVRCANCQRLMCIDTEDTGVKK